MIAALSMLTELLFGWLQRRLVAPGIRGDGGPTAFTQVGQVPREALD
jgi:hypothetical protein